MKAKNDVAVGGGRNLEALKQNWSKNRKRLPVKIIDDRRHECESQHHPAAFGDCRAVPRIYTGTSPANSAIVIGNGFDLKGLVHKFPLSLRGT
jgi:hypothetical protein